MSLSKTIARKFILPAALMLKIDNFFLRKTGKTCCIINFHGVRKSNIEVFNNRHIPEIEFEKIIKYLSSNYNIVPLSEIFEIHRTKRKVNRKTIALTFDDGYANNFNIALPVLKHYNVPATFYIISKCITDDNFYVWPDVIDIIKKYHKQDIVINGHAFNYPQFYNNDIKLDLLDYLKTCGEHTQLLTNNIISKYDYLQKEIKKSPELLFLIKGSEFLKYINEPLIEYGAHSHSHFNMEYLNEKVTETELEIPKIILENILAKPVSTFAFPDGSYTNDTIRIAKKLGYKNLVAVDYKYNESNSDPNLLSRFTISNSTTYASNALRLARLFNKYGFN